MSLFDPQTLMDSVIDAPMTKRPLIPAGSELQGEIADVKVTSIQGKKDPSKTYPKCIIQLKLDTAGVLPGFETLTVVDDFLMDLTDGGALDTAPGKNNRLRIYREALGMNEAGKTFQFADMIGRPIKARIKHDDWEGNIREQIATVTKPA